MSPGLLHGWRQGDHTLIRDALDLNVIGGCLCGAKGAVDTAIRNDPEVVLSLSVGTGVLDVDAGEAFDAEAAGTRMHNEFVLRDQIGH